MSKERKVLYLLASLLILVLVWVFIKRSPPNRDVRYTITDLGTLGGVESLGLEINKRGHVAGIRLASATDQRLFLWTSEKGMADVPVVGKSVILHAMNDRDELAGAYFTSKGEKHAFFWRPSEPMTDLGTLGWEHSEATGINNRSEVVGYFQGTQPASRPMGFVWSATNGMTPIDRNPCDINDSGEILCASGPPGLFYVLNRQTGEVIPPKGLNQSLRTCFEYQCMDRSGGWIWTRIPFENFQEEFSGKIERDFDTYLYDGVRNWVVGNTCYNPRIFRFIRSIPLLGSLSKTDKRAVLWEDGELIDLTASIPPDTEWQVLLSARSINRSGQIGGYGRIGGETHAFLLTPSEYPGESERRP